MEALRSTIVDPAAIWAFVAVLAVWAFASAAWAGGATMRLTRRLVQARRRIDQETDATQFAQHFPAVSADLLQMRYIGPRWQQYRETLVIPATPNRPVRATARAEEWFDMSLCPEAGLDLRYHAALPSLLVGAGLLFTFLGLTVALSAASDVVAAGISQTARNLALHGLLEAASFKFVTSLVGLGLSIAYALFWRQYCLREVERALSGFLTDLENRVVLLTPTAVQQETNELAQRQLDQLEALRRAVEQLAASKQESQ